MVRKSIVEKVMALIILIFLLQVISACGSPSLEGTYQNKTGTKHEYTFKSDGTVHCVAGFIQADLKYRITKDSVMIYDPDGSTEEEWTLMNDGSLVGLLGRKLTKVR